jgi:hypothetical protein
MKSTFQRPRAVAWILIVAILVGPAIPLFAGDGVLVGWRVVEVLVASWLLCTVILTARRSPSQGSALPQRLGAIGWVAYIAGLIVAIASNNGSAAGIGEGLAGAIGILLLLAGAFTSEARGSREIEAAKSK